MPKKSRKGFGIRALTGPGVAVDVTQPYSVKIPVGDRHVSSTFNFQTVFGLLVLNLFEFGA